MAGRKIEDDVFSLRVVEGWDDSRTSFGRRCLPGVSRSLRVDLDDMLIEFATGLKLGRPRDRTREEEPLRLAAATFTQEDATTRVWYVSDGPNFAKLTYTCIGGELDAGELRDCEAMVRSMAFRPP